MKNIVVRLSSLTLENIKNVKNGTIVMPFFNKTDKNHGAEILGIYGQNGSGKTAVIDALFFLQHIFIGKELDRDISDYIDTDSQKAEIKAGFKIFGENMIFEVEYHVVLAKCENKAEIEREYLKCAVNTDKGRTNKNIFMDYQRTDTDSVFKPQKRFEELIGKEKGKKTDLIVAKKIAEKCNCSYIFGENSREIFLNRTTEEFENYSFVINALYNFALKDLFVIRSSHSGLITANFLLPMAFRIEREKMGIKGDFNLPLTEPILLNKEQREILEELVEQINTVLYTIIPEMNIEIKNYGQQVLDSGEDGWKVELMSVRGEKKPIPIRMESEGIIKLVSILNILIHAFGNPSVCLAIDELDSGIFEYMLGELLDVFDKSAKGQLIFTSHNLRALEMLDKECIMFSTVNPYNRFIHMKNVKGTNNLRSMYLRSITLGGQEEMVYKETDSIKIARAFRKAGRRLHDE